MRISRSRYKDLDSFVLENSFIRAEIVPGAGARTASLVYKPAGAELLWQNSAAVHAPVTYAQPFPEGEKAGFDEMFPAVNEFSYPDFPWRGTQLPDHGEVWALPWQVEAAPEGELSLSVCGVRIPYRLTKRLRLEGPVLSAVYSLENPTPFPMAFLYAAHPLFNVDAGDRIIVPDNLRTVTNAVPSIDLPEYGREYPWSDEIAVMPQQTPAAFKKYYFSARNTEGWSVLRREKLGIDLRMSVSPEQLPYLGIWMNEGGWDDQYNLALEPASALMDDPVAARQFDAESVLEANGRLEWTLDIEVTARFS